MYTLDCIRNKPSALSHSDVHLMTHDVQLPAMMCNYTNYTRKIKALLLFKCCLVHVLFYWRR